MIGGVDIVGGIVNAISTLVGNVIQFIFQQLIAPFNTLFTFITSMPIQYTTGNPIVIQAWTAMTIVADAFLGLFVVVGTIQIMYGDATGGLRMPLSQFLAKALLTAILIHMSAFIGEQLLNLNNALTAVAGNSAATFLQTLKNTNGGANIFAIIIIIVLLLIMLGLTFQGIKRIVRFNLLFILSGPAYLLSFHPATEAVFSTWIRMLVSTAFEQFVQFLALTLAIQFIQTTGLRDIAGLLFTIAVMLMVLEVPTLLRQLVGSGSPKGSGMVGNLLKTAAIVKFLL